MERLANSVVPNLVQVLSALIQVKRYTILQYIDIALRLCHISTGENVFIWLRAGAREPKVSFSPSSCHALYFIQDASQSRELYLPLLQGTILVLVLTYRIRGWPICLPPDLASFG